MSIAVSSSLLRTTAILGVCATLLAGCAGDPGPRTAMGAAGGALAGDEEDRRRAYAAEMQALEYGGPGTPVRWDGRGGNYGVIQPGPIYARGAYQKCREYSHTIYVRGRPEVARGVACRNPDGTWSQVS